MEVANNSLIYYFFIVNLQMLFATSVTYSSWFGAVFEATYFSYFLLIFHYSSYFLLIFCMVFGTKIITPHIDGPWPGFRGPQKTSFLVFCIFCQISPSVRGPEFRVWGALQSKPMWRRLHLRLNHPTRPSSHHIRI